jgi:hypothetical protein
MSTDTLAPVGFTYEQGDPSDIPTRPRHVGPGRPSINPHTDVVTRNAGTGQVVKFMVEDVDDDDERRKLVNRHARFIRIAARNAGRGVRIGATPQGDGTLQIAFQDIDYTPRKRKSTDEESDAGE